MELKYVISIKATKDYAGKDCEEWRYAGIDSGSYGSGYPYWFSSVKSAELFASAENAKKWFEMNGGYLFGPYFKRTDFDVSTLGIRKLVLVFQKATPLQVPKE